MTSVTVLKTDDKFKVPIPKNNVENDPNFKEYINKSLEELLDDLVKYGKHSLSWVGDGWYCDLSFYVTVVGVELKIRSDFTNQTHKHAVIQCTIRLHETISQINKQGN